MSGRYFATRPLKKEAGQAPSEEAAEYTERLFFHMNFINLLSKVQIPGTVTLNHSARISSVSDCKSDTRAGKRKETRSVESLR